MSYKEIMQMPYIRLVIGLADVPQVDYSKKIEDKEETIYEPKTAEDEFKALAGFLM